MDFAELERLARAATPGPWSIRAATGATKADERYDVAIIGDTLPRDAEHLPIIGEVWAERWKDHPIAGAAQAYRDAEFIVAMRNALPALLLARRAPGDRDRELIDALPVVWRIEDPTGPYVKLADVRAAFTVSPRAQHEYRVLEDKPSGADAAAREALAAAKSRRTPRLRADSRPEQPAPLDVARLTRALTAVDRQGAIALLGTDYQVDAKGYPTRFDYTGVPAEVAAALAAEYDRLRADSRPEQPRDWRDAWNEWRAQPGGHPAVSAFEAGWSAALRAVRPEEPPE